MVSILALALIGGAAATAATAATGNGATAVAAVVPPGLKVALAHVPSWSHAHQVLTQRLSAYAQNGSAGAGGTAGAGAAVKKALAHGIGRSK